MVVQPSDPAKRGAQVFNQALATLTSKHKRAGTPPTIGGAPRRIPATREEMKQIRDLMLQVSRTKKFRDRARALGFTEEQIKEARKRIWQYYQRDQLAFAHAGGMAHHDKFWVSRSRDGQPRETVIWHELGHVLDDVASDPELFKRSTEPGFGWKGLYDAEYKAHRMQFGDHPFPIASAWRAGLSATENISPIPFAGGAAWILPQFLVGAALGERHLKDVLPEAVQVPLGQAVDPIATAIEEAPQNFIDMAIGFGMSLTGARPTPPVRDERKPLPAPGGNNGPVPRQRERVRPR